MKMNKKGMTLVECIIAMAVFAIATTGFTMAATACVRSQVKYHTRNRNMNTQTTNLEHFSGYSETGNLKDANVDPMDTAKGLGSNMYQVKFEFQNGKIIKNSQVNGYRTVVGDEEDGVFELSFLSPMLQVKVDSNEYWITLYNCSDEEVDWIVSSDSSNIKFFNSDKDIIGESFEDMWADGGEFKRFGIRDNRSEAEKGGASSLIIHIEEPFDEWTKDIEIMDMIDPYGDGSRYGYIYYVGGGSFLTTEQYAELEESLGG